MIRLLIAERLECIAQCRVGLVLDQSADVLRLLTVDVQRADERTVDSRVSQLDAERTAVHNIQRLKRRRQDIQIRHHAGGTHQLDAGLHDLGRVAAVERAGAVHLLVVVQAERKRILIQLGRDDACDRDGIVRTHDEQTAVAVGHLEHALETDRRIRLREYIIVLYRRCDDFLKSAVLEQTADASLVLAEQTGRAEQAVACSLRCGDSISIHVWFPQI